MRSMHELSGNECDRLVRRSERSTRIQTFLFRFNETREQVKVVWISREKERHPYVALCEAQPLELPWHAR